MTRFHATVKAVSMPLNNDCFRSSNRRAVGMACSAVALSRLPSYGWQSDVNCWITSKQFDRPPGIERRSKRQIEYSIYYTASPAVYHAQNRARTTVAPSWRRRCVIGCHGNRIRARYIALSASAEMYRPRRDLQLVRNSPPHCSDVNACLCPCP